jgi:class 3 adenylate cyclase/pimeloyl-ACP methyl ester carboxylesterase
MASQRFEVRYADSGGVSIAWTAVGGGPHDLVMVPGFVSHLEIFWEPPWAERFLRRLTSFARVILWDKRGQGMSDRPGVPPSLQDGMDDLLAVLDAAGALRPALLGASEGGPMTMLFAATHPGRVERLILYGSYARILRAPDYPEGVPEGLLEGFFELLQREWGREAALRPFAPDAMRDAAVIAWGARLLRSGTSPSGARDLLALYRDIDVRDILPAIRVPTLVLHRGGDLIATAAQGRYIAARIPDARYVELPGSDHVPVLGDVDPLLDEIEEAVTGERHRSQPDRVLATVLFTDICRSTERAAELGDRRWRDLLVEHDAMVRREVERHRGRLIKPIGDGTLATFDGPARAIDAALAIRDAVGALGLQVRAGLHTGECELIGQDVGGLAVHIAARVTATAEPGEIRVSRTVTDLVAGSGRRFAERGTRVLKGVPGRWQLFAVDGEQSKRPAALQAVF